MSVGTREWLELIEREYLRDFVREGGAAVKLVVVADRAAGDDLLREVERAAEEAGYLAARVDGAQVKVHLMQSVFFAVATQVPWRELAQRVVREHYASVGYRVPGDDLSAEAVARLNGLDPSLLHAEMRRSIETILRLRGELARDFRLAMTWLCLSEVWPGAADREAILEWLRGELRLVSALRGHLIFRKIGRHNARAMLSSLGAWVRAVGLPGTVLTLDLRRLGVARRADVPEGGVYYTRAAVWDAYEVLRQLIDATDDLSGLLTVVLAEPAMFEHETRGVPTYKALHERVWSDVRLRQRDNPLSSLARLGDGEPGP